MIACALRTTVVYLVLIAAVRLMGKRQIGQLEASEFVVTMLAANLAALPIEDPEFSMKEGITAIVVLTALEQLLSRLGERDRRLITLRYLGRKTQQATATLLGMSQVQVSRRERALLEQLRRELTG